MNAVTYMPIDDLKASVLCAMNGQKSATMKLADLTPEVARNLMLCKPRLDLCKRGILVKGVRDGVATVEMMY